MNTHSFHIAVCGDIHGHITLTWLLLERWQEQTKKRLDAILQVGDMGILLPSKIDKATMHFAEKDPDELSFARDFLQGSSQADELMDRKVAPIIFVRGNHDDIEYLTDCQRQARGQETVQVDHYGKLRYLPNGQKTILSRERTIINIGALGGTTREENKRFTRREITTLQSQEPIDILLTHEPYLGGYSPDTGAQEITELIDHLQPTYAFCGDLHREGRELPRRNKTRAYLLNEVNFFKRRRLNEGCIGILEWQNPTNHHFNFLRTEKWFPDITRDNYREQLQAPQRL